MYIEVNNGQSLQLTCFQNGMQVTKRNRKEEVESRFLITNGELVMLLNYYRNCKEGRENNDYIEKGDLLYV